MYKITLTKIEVLEFKTKKEMAGYVRLCGIDKISVGEEIFIKENNNNSLKIKYESGREKKPQKGNCY